MSAILELPEVRRRVSPISVEDYRHPEQGQEKRIAASGELIECMSVPAVRIQVSNLFA